MGWLFTLMVTQVSGLVAYGPEDVKVNTCSVQQMVEIVGDTVAYQMLNFLTSTVNNVGLAVWLLVL